MEVIIVYNSKEQIEKIKGETFKVSPFFTFINENNRKSRKSAFALKNHWAAWETPFAICMEGENPIKAFYSENCDVINSLISYLHEYNIHS